MRVDSFPWPHVARKQCTSNFMEANLHQIVHQIVASWQALRGQTAVHAHVVSAGSRQHKLYGARPLDTELQPAR